MTTMSKNKLFALSLTLVLGPLWLAYAHFSRWPTAIGPDGLSYLEQADFWQARNWADAVSSYWSPLYPLLIVLLKGLWPFNSQTEFFATHVLNLALLSLVTLGTCIIWRQLDRTLCEASLTEHQRTVLWAVSFLVNCYVSVIIIPPSLVAPDALLTAILVWATIAAAKCVSQPARLSLWILLGMLAGLAYLAKAPGLFLGASILSCAWLLSKHTGARANHGFSLAVGAALVIAGPWVLAVSRADHKLTIGSSASLNFAWHVTGQAPWNQGGRETAPGVLANQDAPRITSYQTHPAGSYPFWYAPQRWAAEKHEPYRLSRHLWWLTENIREAKWLLLQLLALLMVIASRSPNVRQLRALAETQTLVPILAAASVIQLLIFLPVSVVHRYLAFAMIALATSTAYVLLTAPPTAMRFAARLVFGVGIAMQCRDLRLVPVTPLTYSSEYKDENGLVAGLQAKGVGAGELVAVVGASQFGAAWARVARVHIVAETTDSLAFADYWRASDSTRSTVLRAFAQAGARAVVIWPLDTGHADCGPKPRPTVELLSFSSSDRSPVVPNGGTPK